MAVWWRVASVCNAMQSVFGDVRVRVRVRGRVRVIDRVLNLNIISPG